jgi:septum formation protein
MTLINGKQFVLASASPRRKHLLENLGLTLNIIPSGIDEPENDDIAPEEYVKNLALSKAEAIAKQLDIPSVVLGADTTVVIDGMSLGKPDNYDDAYEMLQRLSGRTHRVVTGFAIIDTATKQVISDYESSEVRFKELTPEEIHYYVKTGEPMDKAGAYAIQGLGSAFVMGIKGCYTNIVGLPVFKIALILKDLGLDILEFNANKV